MFKRRGKLALVTGKANEVLESKLTRLLSFLIQEAGREEGNTNQTSRWRIYSQQKHPSAVVWGEAVGLTVTEQC